VIDQALPLGLKVPPGSSAKFATDGPYLYRYELRRRWTFTGAEWGHILARSDYDGVPEPDPSRPMVVIGLNPSVADATSDDPTIRRCVGFAKREGCGEVVMVNLYALVATDPDDLLHDGCATDGERGIVSNAVGIDNNHTIAAAMVEVEQRGGLVVGAWGATHARYIADRVAVVRKLIGALPVWCLGTTRSGAPKHPLYLRNDAPLIPWSPK
jgi:hypothetical protein